MNSTIPATHQPIQTLARALIGDGPGTNVRTGMSTSLLGTLNGAAATLRGMAKPLEAIDEQALAAMEHRSVLLQPDMHAEHLDALALHLRALESAVRGGDIARARRFFEIYRFD